MFKNSFGLLGYKAGMVSYLGDCTVEAATIVGFDSCVVMNRDGQLDGQDRLRIAFFKAKKINKPIAGIYNKAGIQPHKMIREFVLPKNCLPNLVNGKEIDSGFFKVGQVVNVSSRSKGRGFAGVVKRHGFKDRGRSSISLSHRVHGSTGQRTSPGRVFPGKKMAGHYGNEFVTVLGLRILHVNTDDNYVIIKGAVPGSRGSVVFVGSKL